MKVLSENAKVLLLFPVVFVSTCPNTTAVEGCLQNTKLHFARPCPFNISDDPVVQESLLQRQAFVYENDTLLLR